MMLSLESLVSQCDLCFADSLVPGWRLVWGTKKIFSKEEEVGNIQGGSEHFSGHFKCHFGSQIICVEILGSVVFSWGWAVFFIWFHLQRERVSFKRCCDAVWDISSKNGGPVEHN